MAQLPAFEGDGRGKDPREGITVGQGNSRAVTPARQDAARPVSPQGFEAGAGEEGRGGSSAAGSGSSPQSGGPPSADWPSRSKHAFPPQERTAAEVGRPRLCPTC